MSDFIIKTDACYDEQMYSKENQNRFVELGRIIKNGIPSGISHLLDGMLIPYCPSDLIIYGIKKFSINNITKLEAPNMFKDILTAFQALILPEKQYDLASLDGTFNPWNYEAVNEFNNYNINDAVEFMSVEKTKLINYPNHLYLGNRIVGIWKYNGGKKLTRKHYILFLRTGKDFYCVNGIDIIPNTTVSIEQRGNLFGDTKFNKDLLTCGKIAQPKYKILEYAWNRQLCNEELGSKKLNISGVKPCIDEESYSIDLTLNYPTSTTVDFSEIYIPEFGVLRVGDNVKFYSDKDHTGIVTNIRTIFSENLYKLYDFNNHIAIPSIEDYPCVIVMRSNEHGILYAKYISKDYPNNGLIKPISSDNDDENIKLLTPDPSKEEKTKTIKDCIDSLSASFDNLNYKSFYKDIKFLKQAKDTNHEIICIFNSKELKGETNEYEVFINTIYRFRKLKDDLVKHNLFMHIIKEKKTGYLNDYGYEIVDIVNNGLYVAKSKITPESLDPAICFIPYSNLLKNICNGILKNITVIKIIMETEEE